MSKDTSQVLSIVQNGESVRGPVNNCSLRVYKKQGVVTFLASRAVDVPELIFLEGQHSSRHPTHLDLVSSKLETWAFRPTEPHRPTCVFSCIPAEYVSKREAGMAGTHPPSFPESPSYSQHHCLNSVCSKANFSGAGELEVLPEQVPPKAEPGCRVLGAGGKVELGLTQLLPEENEHLPLQGLHELDANEAASRRGGASSILIGCGWPSLAS